MLPVVNGLHADAYKAREFGSGNAQALPQRDESFGDEPWRAFLIHSRHDRSALLCESSSRSVERRDHSFELRDFTSMIRARFSKWTYFFADLFLCKTRDFRFQQNGYIGHR